MQEILLLFSCINGFECSKTYQTYSFYNKSTIEHAESTVRPVKEAVPVVISNYLVPIYSIYAGSAVNFRVSNEAIIGVSNERVYISYVTEF